MVLLFVLTLLGCGRVRSIGGAKDVDQKDKLSDGNEWVLFVPSESLKSGCSMEMTEQVGPSGGKVMKLVSESTARFGIRGPVAHPVTPGERYRLSAWVKVGKDSVARGTSPGVLLRATLFTAQGTDFKGGHFHAGTRGVTLGDPDALYGTPVPVEWSKIDAVIEIPADVAHVMLFAFSWGVKGAVYIDGLMIERTSANVKLSQVF